MTALGVVDMLFVLNRFFFIGVAQLFHTEDHHDANFKITWPIMIPIRYFLYQCSAYFTVLLSLERYLSVCKQHSVPFKRIKIYIGLIVLFSFLYNFPICFERWYEWDKDNKEYKIFYTRLRKKDELIGQLYTQVYETYMYNIFYIALPLVCLIVFNILIVKKVCLN